MLKTNKGTPCNRFIEEHSIPVTECGCWLWDCDEGEYVKLDGIKTKVDRVAYEAFYSCSSASSDIVHDCNIACCVNPKHMHLESHH